MAHAMDDLYRMDLYARGWVIYDRLMVGASGGEHWVSFVGVQGELDEPVARVITDLMTGVR